MSQRVVWITGASSGIGLSLTKRYLDEGCFVIASARTEGELSKLIDVNDSLKFVPFDVSDESQIDSTRQAIAEYKDYLDCVILNAGTCEYLTVDDDNTDWGMMERIMSVNFYGMVNSVKLCLPLLKKSSQPHLVGVSSQAVQAAFPQAEAYGASKAAVRYFLSSLRMDLIPFGVDVTCILPGFVDTPLTRKNTFPMPFLMSSDDAAKRMFLAIESRRFEYAFPKRLSAMLWAGRHFPKLWLSMLGPKNTAKE